MSMAGAGYGYDTAKASSHSVVNRILNYYSTGFAKHDPSTTFDRIRESLDRLPDSKHKRILVSIARTLYMYPGRFDRETYKLMVSWLSELLDPDSVFSNLVIGRVVELIGGKIYIPRSTPRLHNVILKEIVNVSGAVESRDVDERISTARRIIGVTKSIVRGALASIDIDGTFTWTTLTTPFRVVELLVPFLQSTGLDIRTESISDEGLSDVIVKVIDIDNNDRSISFRVGLPSMVQGALNSIPTVKSVIRHVLIPYDVFLRYLPVIIADRLVEEGERILAKLRGIQRSRIVSIMEFSPSGLLKSQYHGLDSGPLGYDETPLLRHVVLAPFMASSNTRTIYTVYHPSGVARVDRLAVKDHPHRELGSAIVEGMKSVDRHHDRVGVELSQSARDRMAGYLYNSIASILGTERYTSQPSYRIASVEEHIELGDIDIVIGRSRLVDGYATLIRLAPTSHLDGVDMDLDTAVEFHVEGTSPESILNEGLYVLGLDGLMPGSRLWEKLVYALRRTPYIELEDWAVSLYHVAYSIADAFPGSDDIWRIVSPHAPWIYVGASRLLDEGLKVSVWRDMVLTVRGNEVDDRSAPVEGVRVDWFTIPITDGGIYSPRLDGGIVYRVGGGFERLNRVHRQIFSRYGGRPLRTIIGDVNIYTSVYLPYILASPNTEKAYMAIDDDIVKLTVHMKGSTKRGVIVSMTGRIYQ